MYKDLEIRVLTKNVYPVLNQLNDDDLDLGYQILNIITEDGQRLSEDEMINGGLIAVPTSFHLLIKRDKISKLKNHLKGLIHSTITK